MIAFVGLKRSTDVLKVLYDIGLDRKDYMLISSGMAVSLPDDVILVVCGKGVAVDKFGCKRNTIVIGSYNYSHKLQKDIFVATSINNMRHNADVVKSFTLQMNNLLNVKSEYNTDPTIHIISTPSELDVPQGSDLVYDLETTGTKMYSTKKLPLDVDTIRFCVFAKDVNNAYIVSDEDLMVHKEEWQKLFFRSDITFIAHSIDGFDIKFLMADKRICIQARTDFDTLQAHHRLFNGQRHSLKPILAYRYGFPEYEKEIDTYVHKKTPDKRMTYKDVPLDIFHWYAAKDAVGELLLKRDLEQELIDANMYNTFIDTDMPFHNALANNWHKGRYIDMKYLATNAINVLYPAIKELEVKMRNIARNPALNCNSPSQIANVFIGLKIPKYTKDMGTSVKVIDKLATYDLTPIQREFITTIKEYRKNKIIDTTFCKGAMKMVDVNHRVYPIINQTGTVVYRPSTKQPNIANVPKTTAGKFIRESYIASPGNVFVHADGSGSQLRIAASLSGDEAMLYEFNNNGDLHAKTLSSIFDFLDEEYQADPSQARRWAKGANFALIFKGSVYTLKTKMPAVPIKILKLLFNGFYSTYPQYVRYSRGVMDKALCDLYVTNQFGYKRTWPSRHARKLEEQASNFPISSTEAFVFNRSYTQATQAGLDVVLHLYDELAIECPIDEAEDQANELMRIMLNNYALINNNIVWKVEAEIKHRWKPIESEKVIKLSMEQPVGA